MPGSRYVIVFAEINAGIRRQYEIPVESDGADRQAFVRWLLDVIPTGAERVADAR